MAVQYDCGKNYFAVIPKKVIEDSAVYASVGLKLEGSFKKEFHEIMLLFYYTVYWVKKIS